MRIVRSLDVTGDEFFSDLVATFENDWQRLTGGKLEAGGLCEGLSWRSDQAHLLVRSFDRHASSLWSVRSRRSGRVPRIRWNRMVTVVR